MANCMQLQINDDYIIDIENQVKIRDFERNEFERNEFEYKNKLENKIYPLPCQNYHCPQVPILKRYYKAVCKICLSISSTTNKNRDTLCFECESKFKILDSKHIRVICYKCNQTTLSFKKNKSGFICNHCSYIKQADIQTTYFCPICEYETINSDQNSICNSCISGDIRKARILKEVKVICCNCEQVAIQLNPHNTNVFCNECKAELLNYNIV
jgi:hypothetical protein